MPRFRDRHNRKARPTRRSLFDKDSRREKNFISPLESYSREEMETLDEQAEEAFKSLLAIL